MAQAKHTDASADRPPAKTLGVAPVVPNTLVLTGIGLGTIGGEPGKWSFHGVDGGAFVLCRQETNGGLPIASKWLHYGRTTTQGWVVEVEASELDEPVKESGGPPKRTDLMLLYPDEQYRIFWSFDRDHFMEVKRGLEAGEHDLEPSKVLSIDFDFVRLAQQDIEKLDVLAWLREQGKLDEDCCYVIETHLLNAQRGYTKRTTNDPRGAVAMIDVTPAPLQALLRAEFLHWYAQMATERSQDHLAALYRARSVIEARETGAADAVLEALVSERYAQHGTPEREVFEKYRVYAWKCAAAGQGPDEFKATLPMSFTQVQRSSPDLTWEALARTMRVVTATSPYGAAEHPGLDAAIQHAGEPERSNRRFRVLLSKQSGLQWIQSYFDMYRLGSRLERARLEGRGALLAPLLDDFDREWERTRNGALPGACRLILSRGPYNHFLLALLQRTASERERLRYLERYFDACALAEQCWWKSLHEPRTLSAEGSLWKHLRPSVKWMAEALKGVGKTLSGLVEARLGAYTLGFQEAHALMEALFRHEIALSGASVEPGVHYLERVSDRPGAGPNFRAQINLNGGMVTVTRDVPLDDAPDVQVKLQMLSRVGRPGFRLEPGRPQNAHAYALAQTLQAGYAKELLVPVDLAELKRRHTLLPKGFAACAEVINVASAATTLADQWRRGLGFKEQLEPTWELTKGVVALADSVQSMIKAMQRPLEAEDFLKKASKLAGLKQAASVTGGIDGVLKIRKGCTLLFSDEGELEYELRQDRGTRATLQAVKGIMQVAQGSVGLIAAIPATAALAATPAGLVIAVGAALIVASIDVALDATQEFTDHVAALERAVDAAKPVELLERSFRVSYAVRAATEHVGRLG